MAIPEYAAGVIRQWFQAPAFTQSKAVADAILSIVNTANAGVAATGVTPGTYGNGTNVGQFTVGADGRITSASNVPIASSGTVTSVGATSANADLTITGSPITTSGTFNFTINSAPKWSTARTLSFTGDATGSGSVDGSANVATALTLANSGVSAGTYGSATAIPVVQFDAKGRAVSASEVAITSTAFAPLTTGAEPIVLVSDGAGQCIMVPI